MSIINLAARQRMLSQRLVLLILLAAQGQVEKAEAAESTLRLFTDSQASILRVLRDKGMPATDTQLMQDVYLGPAGVSEVVTGFITDCRRALDLCKGGGVADRADALECVVSRIDVVLAALNRATQALDQINTRNEATLVRQIGEIVEEIRLVAREAKVVSFNAQVIAARAGVVGREFSVVAGTLSRISGEVDKLAHKGLSLVKG
ncbi:type IV pili methyl-accepting chemotaxis transducer N-terminal domain-containing protein [Paucibacter sp. hw1]|uniref:Type IV pili methyl-accepting chemotaxis transducer N-terminal domain-containing protein n=2 Tax=Roseateles koreensis TaxID=2987526 RepID=A0ABT5KW95_9BURK|nr:type IV pili methyl-accepting chemotaxis transducer N-terminal domain-containing protein [Roseateles koreensis]